MNGAFTLHDEQALRTIDIHQLLRQQEPFVLIDRLTAINEAETVTETTVRESLPFFASGKWQAEGMIENVAQTCAVRLGYINTYILHREVEVGYIGQLSKMRIHALPAAGDVVRTTVTEIESVWAITLAHAVVKSGSETLLEGDIKIALKRKER